jgi:hypothetical protein
MTLRVIRDVAQAVSFATPKKRTDTTGLRTMESPTKWTVPKHLDAHPFFWGAVFNRGSLNQGLGLAGGGNPGNGSSSFGGPGWGIFGSNGGLPCPPARGTLGGVTWG